MSSDPKIIGYCRACGKALDETTVRNAQGTIFCLEHAPVPTVNIGTSTPGALPATSGSSGSTPHTTPSYHAPASPYANPYAGTQPPPLPTFCPAGQGGSPGLAFFLGLIPGVGAVYNGQYAKGLIHVVIVGILISVMSSGSAYGLEPLLGMLTACFWFYMAFEAFHTAKRRKQGEPLDEFSSIMPMGARTSTRFPVGPVLLIALGVLFLLNNLDLLDIHKAARYWPAALIVYGLNLLYLRIRDNSALNNTSPAPPAAPTGPTEAGEPPEESRMQ